MALTEDVIGRIENMEMEVVHADAALHLSVGTVWMGSLGSRVGAAGRRSHVTGVVYGIVDRKETRELARVK